jgi:hypothetical protein
MAASQASLELRNNTDANFRLWGKFISDGLLAGGWTLESTDINWTTVSAPAQNTYAGYEIWKSPDEVGLTNFYLKLRYGSSNNAAPAVMLEYQLGWGYSGSGSSLSGVVGTARATVNSTAASSTSQLCSVSAGDGYAVINLGNGIAAVGVVSISIGRGRNSSLEKIDLIQHFHSYATSGTAVTQRMSMMDTRQEYPSTTASATYLAIIDALNSVQWGTVGLTYIQGHSGPRSSILEELLGVHTLNNTTISILGQAGQTVTIPVYGVNRTYLIGQTSNSNGTTLGPTTGVHPLFLYE